MPVKIFFCYAHEDKALLDKLKYHLTSLQRLGLIDQWHDGDINAGTEWEKEIEKHLNTAQIILLLVSAYFMRSDYCYGIEMKRAIERHERGEATVIPIILRPVFWQGIFGNLQALPKDAKPVTGPTWHNLDMAFYNIALGIREVVESLLPEPPPVDPKVVGKGKKEQPDPQAFGELKRVYSWLSDKHLDFLQVFYQTWKQLAGAYQGDLLDMLSGITLPTESPGITWDQVGFILAFARAKVRLQEEETT